ncbi:FAD-binding oxidoreductase [Erythrobacteraceae bacterium CFH 75059]|uniref:NAD(P)/FAD-dependent oxidoreductase n=1 Tax=Qipengyuania thermophila TaxID=2509361 RepID=UPI00101EC7D2|nr:FAD-dependent oxidoreductase [Qipengyuania thermophila]TCD06216.1 FAD-binding oxidoreductase [Erythrobacteraceae bacterium CFH 75059]
MTDEACDIAVIGAGIAGASIAAELAALLPRDTRILLLERESVAGYHTTGRSAAFWEECYGGPALVPLTRASGAYLRDRGFLSERGALYIAQADAEAEVDSFLARFAPTGAELYRLGAADLQRRVPQLRARWVHGIWQPHCADIDVAALHQHYLRRAAAAGVRLRVKAGVGPIDRTGSGWRLRLDGGGTLTAGALVNAAGAWSDCVAAAAGLRAPGIQPLRRTVVQVRVDPPAPRDLPLVLDISGRFYFRPEGDRLWLSPHDETPSPPCDAAPEELDVAVAISRLEEATGWRVEAVERRWAGLRSFAPDRLPVYGPDPGDRAFIWFAGQGGSGIQTAPAAARLMAEAVAGSGRSAMTADLDLRPFGPERLG